MRLEKEKQKRCEKCNSTLIYFRVKKSQFVCRSCGNIERVKEEIKDAISE